MRRLPYFAFPVKLDLGCGQNKIDGFVGLDCGEYGQEIAWDFNQGIPLPNDSVTEFHSSHTFEHVKWEELAFLLSEIVRVCKDDVRLTIIVPHSDTKEAHYLCHYSLWNERVVEGVVADHPNLALEVMSRDGIHFRFVLRTVKGRKKP